MTASSSGAPAPKAAPAPAPADDDDDVDLFGEEDEEEAAAAAAARKEAAAASKKKEAPVGKTSILLDVKPWDDETDMAALEASVRTLTMDGLHWGASKLVPVAFGVKKMQIMCTVVDDLVGTDDLEEHILAQEDYVQSMDIVAMNKI